MGMTEQERMSRPGDTPLPKPWQPSPLVEQVLRDGVHRSQKLLDEYLARKTEYENKPADLSTGVTCPRCGGLMIQTGACHTCTQCGDSTGCG